MFICCNFRYLNLRVKNSPTHVQINLVSTKKYGVGGEGGLNPSQIAGQSDDRGQLELNNPKNLAK